MLLFDLFFNKEKKLWKGYFYYIWFLNVYRFGIYEIYVFNNFYNWLLFLVE